MSQGSPPRMKIVRLFSGESPMSLALTTTHENCYFQRSIRAFLHLRKNPIIGLHRTFYASSGNCCRESICTFCETELEKEGISHTTPCISWPAHPVVRRLLPITS